MIKPEYKNHSYFTPVRAKMKIIKNNKELAGLVNEHKDLILPHEDVRIEFEPTDKEIRNVECKNLYLENDVQKFDFNGEDFNGEDFNGRNFNGRDFNGLNFNGKKISYYGVFICYNSCKCESIKGRRENSIHKVLDGEIEFIKPEEDTVEIIVEGKTKRISKQSAEELNLI